MKFKNIENFKILIITKLLYLLFMIIEISS